MQFKIQLQIIDDNQQLVGSEEVTVLDKPTHVFEEIGMRLSESKTILGNLQEQIISYQTQDYMAHHCTCPSCQQAYRKKGTCSLQYQSLFGNIRLSIPRFYQCTCQTKKGAQAKTFSPLHELFKEHISPERLYLEAKWAALFPFQKTVDLFQDVFPLKKQLNTTAIKNHLTKIAARMEAELAEEKYMFIEGCEGQWMNLPIPERPIAVGLDGGFVKDWNNKKSHFEVIAGKSIPTDRETKFFGFVDTYAASKPKRILFETLKAQGLQANQQIEFLSDGADNLRNLQH